MASDLFPSADYHKLLLDRISASGISPRKTITGFFRDRELSENLAVVHAVVLPFRGVQSCNTPINGATRGAFVLTTSLVYSGYDDEKNIYWAKPGNVDEMITALSMIAGIRSSCMPMESKLHDITNQHLKIYEQAGGA
jgi:hypothetical protein